MCNRICRFKHKIEDDSTSDSFSLDGKDNVMKSPHGNAVQVPGVNAVKSSKGTREEYIHNIQELKMEVAKSKPNKTDMKRLLQVNQTFVKAYDDYLHMHCCVYVF